MRDFPAIKVFFPEKDIFLRLGGHLTKTQLSGAEKCRFLSAAHTAFEACTPCGRWDIAPVKHVDDNGITLADGTLIIGKDFASRCQGITHLWFAAATVGEAVVALRDGAEKISTAAVYDAAASEIADAAMDFLHRSAAQELRKQQLVLDERRYSPGYGDMPLEMQIFFFARLHLAELNMSLYEHFFMLPEKSVTAFAGIRKDNL